MHTNTSLFKLLQTLDSRIRSCKKIKVEKDTLYVPDEKTGRLYPFLKVGDIERFLTEKDAENYACVTVSATKQPLRSYVLLYDFLEHFAGKEEVDKKIPLKVGKFKNLDPVQIDPLETLTGDVPVQEKYLQIVSYLIKNTDKYDEMEMRGGLAKEIILRKQIHSAPLELYPKGGPIEKIRVEEEPQNSRIDIIFDLRPFIMFDGRGAVKRKNGKLKVLRRPYTFKSFKPYLFKGFKLKMGIYEESGEYEVPTLVEYAACPTEKACRKNKHPHPLSLEYLDSNAHLLQYEQYAQKGQNRVLAFILATEEMIELITGGNAYVSANLTSFETFEPIDKEEAEKMYEKDDVYIHPAYFK